MTRLIRVDWKRPDSNQAMRLETFSEVILLFSGPARIYGCEPQAT